MHAGNKQTVSLRILLGLAISVGLAFGANLEQQEQPLAKPNSGSTDQLDSLIQGEAKSSSGAGNCENGQLHQLMDNLALKLGHAITKNSNKLQLLGELKDAINVGDLLKAGSGIITVNVGQPSATKAFNRFEEPSGGLLDALGDDNNNSEHIVHAKRQLSEEALKELEEFANSGSVSAEKFFKFYSDPRWNKNYRKGAEGNRWDRIQAIKSFLIESFDKGADAIEKLYVSAAFLEQIPIIGQQVTELKRQGQFTYDLIRTIKSFKHFVENYQKGQKIEVKLTGQGRQMLSQVGINALKSVALNLLRAHSGSAPTPANISEVASRTAYYLLIQFAPHSKGCALNAKPASS